MDDIAELTGVLENIAYPPGIMRVVPGGIRRAAFFPGGSGVVVGRDPPTMMPGRALPRGGVMVVGHNFHNVANYEETVQAGGEIGRNSTWANLPPVLTASSVDPEECFFTNALMGLIDGDSATGSHRGHRNPEFRDGCHRLFSVAIEIQRPRLMIALGKPAANFVGEAFCRLDPTSPMRAWTRLMSGSFSAFDARKSPGCSLNLSWPGHNGRFSAVALTHPCMRGSNVWRRTHGSQTGHDAELAMLREAMLASGMVQPEGAAA